MYTPELTLYSFMKQYGTPTTKESAPAELPLVIGLVLHMYMRLWTPNNTTSIDVRSLPYALQKSSHVGAKTVAEVYKAAIMPSDKIRLIDYQTFKAMVVFYRLDLIAQESPFFDAVLQAVSIAWCYSNSDDSFIMATKILPDMSSGLFVEIMPTTCNLKKITGEHGMNGGACPLYVAYLRFIISEIRLRLNDGLIGQIQSALGKQRIGNINPYAIVGVPRRIVKKLDDVTGVRYQLDAFGGFQADLDLQHSTHRKSVACSFSTWSALYFLPNCNSAELIKNDISACQDFSLYLSDAASPALEADAFDAINNLDVPNKGDKTPDNADTSKVDENSEVSADEYAEDATSADETVDDNEDMTTDANSETTSSGESNNNNNVGDQAESGETVQSALKLYFLRQGIAKLFRLAKEKGVAGDLLNVVPMLYLMDKTDLAKLKKQIVSALNKLPTQG